MNFLEELHKKIDENSWDLNDVSLINEEFLKVYDKIIKTKENELLRKIEFERQVFAFQKTPEKGLSPKVSGTKKSKNNIDITFEWPEIQDWKQKDFDYIIERFKKCKNLFAKTEYGLFLFYSGNLSHNENVKELLEKLVKLAEEYLKNAKTSEKYRQYFIYFRLVLANALHIAGKRKNNPQIKIIFQDLIFFIFNTHKNFKINHKASFRILMDLTVFAVQYHTDFKKYVDIEEILEKNLDAAKHLKKTNKWGSLGIIDESIKLSKKHKLNYYDWSRLKAELYEDLADDAIGTPRHMVAIDFINKALENLKRIKDNKNVKRLETKYQEIRGSGELRGIETTFSERESKKIIDRINKEVLSKKPSEILDIFKFCPMFKPLEEINKEIEKLKTEYPSMHFIGVNITDKFGNIIATYPPDSNEWAFLQSYEYNFQLSTQYLIHYFLKSIETEKLNYDHCNQLLEKTWLNKSIKRNYNGYIADVYPLDLLKEPLKKFFDELNLWKTDKNYIPEFITITDSLIIKIEAILRYFCETLGIATFKQKPGNNSIVMEKNLDDLLASLEHKSDNHTNFDENDRRFIKFILTEKAGLNLRNKIAHGLLDKNEYTIEKPILAFTCILRISKYKFFKKNKDE